MSRFLAALFLSLLTASSAYAQAGLGPPIDGRGQITANPTRPQIWSAPQSLSPIILPYAATVNVPLGAGLYFLTLTGNVTKLACPGNMTGLPVRWITIDITQGGSGGYSVTPDTCYGFPNFGGLPLCTYNMQSGCLASEVGAITEVSCYTVPSSYGVMRCGALPAIGYGVLVRNNAASGNCSSSTSCSVTINNLVAGDLAVFGVRIAGNNNNPTLAEITSVGDNNGNTCTYSPNSYNTIPNGFRAVSIWYCPIINAASSGIFTASLSVTDSFSYIGGGVILGAAASTPDALLSNTANGTSTTPSVAATGAIPQPNDFVFTTIKGEVCTGGCTITPGQTQLVLANQGGSPDLQEYQIPASGTPTGSATMTSGTWVASIAVFTHK